MRVFARKACPSRRRLRHTLLIGSFALLLLTSLPAQRPASPPPVPPAVAQVPGQAQTQSDPLNDLMEEAEDLYERGRVEAARERWTRVIALGRRSPQAAAALLRLAQTEPDLHEALYLSERIVLEHPDRPEAQEALALQVRAHWLLGDLQSVILASQAYLREAPQGPQAEQIRQRLISALIETGNPQQALAEWESLATAQPEVRRDADMLMVRVEALLAMEEWQQATEALGDLTARFPNREVMPRAHLTAGLCLERLNRWNEALGYYQRLAVQWPNAPEARIAEERLEAIGRFQRALAGLSG